jgi:hypothetical protein
MKKMASFRADETILNQLKEHCNKKGIKQGWAIQTALNNYLNPDNKIYLNITKENMVKLRHMVLEKGKPINQIANDIIEGQLNENH